MMKRRSPGNRNNGPRLFFPSAVLFALAGLILLASYMTQRALPTAFIETYYSRGWFRLHNLVFSHISGLIPFSIAELIVYLLIIFVAAAVVLLLIFLSRFIKRRRKITSVFFPRFCAFVAALVFIASALFGQLQLLWALNHYRQPLSVSLELDMRPRSTGELNALCVWLADTAGEVRAALPEDARGVVDLGSSGGMLDRTPAAMRSLWAISPLFSSAVPRPKPVLFSTAMALAGISGIYVPFTYEANVNIAQPDLLIPVTACHETAHVLGFAREDEANFIGFLACYESGRQGNASFAYSGLMLALISAGNQLCDLDADAYAALYDSYSPAMKRDLENYNAFWDAYKGPVEEAMTQVNDNYLKLHDQADGVKSYGRMVDLMLACYEAGWLH